MQSHSGRWMIHPDAWLLLAVAAVKVMGGPTASVSVGSEHSWCQLMAASSVTMSLCDRASPVHEVAAAAPLRGCLHWEVLLASLLEGASSLQLARLEVQSQSD